MKQNIRILVEEHENILIVAQAVINKCKEMNKNSTIDKEFIVKTIKFIQGYADKFHHLKEEDLLFVQAQNNNLLTHCSPIEQMLYEHNVGREYISAAIKGLETQNLGMIIHSLENYADLIEEHIYKENNILYPMIDEEMKGDLDEYLVQEYTKVAKENSIKEYMEFVDYCKELIRLNEVA